MVLILSILTGYYHYQACARSPKLPVQFNFGFKKINDQFAFTFKNLAVKVQK